MKRSQLLLAAILSASVDGASATALDDIKIEISHELCAGEGAIEKSYSVYGTNLAASQAIDATFKYDSNPPQQHFILFDANLNPITDRFPKSYARRLNPREKARIGCTSTERAAPQGSIPASVPIVISKQAASYVDASAAEPRLTDARAFAGFLLQGGNADCGAGSKPPGRLYLVNLHPFARLSASLDRFDDRGTRVGAQTHELPAFSALKLGCSNGSSKPGPITTAALEIAAGIATTLSSAPATEAQPTPLEHNSSPPGESPALVPLALGAGAILRTQNICAGSVPSGWIKINDAWNPTVCGKPAAISYNVWTIQQFSEEPGGAVIQACKGSVPPGWAAIDASWNPTVCGHPAASQQNVMVIKRLN